MILAGSLIVGAATFAWLAPAGLRRVSAASRDPLTAITCWIASIIAVVATFAAGVGLLLVPGDHPVSVAVDCWTALHQAQMPELDEVFGVVGGAALLLGAGRFLTAIARQRRSGRHVHRAHLNLARIIGGTDAASRHTLWLRHTTPLAYSIAGKPGMVVASTGLRRLSADQVSAVLCHEHAHLLGRHHLLTSLTRALAVSVPGVPLFRDAPAAIDVLVELAADTAAVRVWGAQTVRGALLALNHHGGAPEHTLAMAREAVTQRLRRLDEGVHLVGSRRLRVVRCGVGFLLVAAPALLGVATLTLAAALCQVD